MGSLSYHTNVGQMVVFKGWVVEWNWECGPLYSSYSATLKFAWRILHFKWRVCTLPDFVASITVHLEIDGCVM